MLIHLHGGGFRNRGAQLMLWTAIEQIGRRVPEAKFCVEHANSDFRERASYGLYTIAPRTPSVSRWKSAVLFRFGNALSRLAPRAEVERYGVVRRADVNAMVDISGYAFGDKWPASKAAALAMQIRSMRRRGAPVIMLPQMFGPFQKPEVVEAFRPILDGCSLIYARDEPSLACLEEINHTKRPLGLAPDITIFTDPVAPSEQPGQPYACLVPNNKMLAHGEGSWEAVYVERMVEAARRLEGNGVTPRVLIHESTAEDSALGQEILDRLGRPDDPMLIESDPRKIKGLIAGAKMLVGSRFHAIVASLSTGTPAIVMGWAHKYEALMNDFGTPEYVHRHDQQVSELHDQIDRLSDHATNEEVARRLADRKDEMKETNQKMWDRVVEEITSAKS